MKIKVKSLQGDEYIVDVQNDQLVSDLKASISEKANGLAIERQKLVYKGRTMQDTNSIVVYNLEEGCKVHLILQKECSDRQQIPIPSSSSATTATTSNPCPMDATNRLQNEANNMTNSTAQNNPIKPQSKFERMLRERLANHFAPDEVEKIMANLQHEINADINSSSLDDLERLAKQKLNISNE